MPSHPKAADLPALLATLCDSEVEFIIVGGVAAVLQGVPITTSDRPADLDCDPAGTQQREAIASWVAQTRRMIRESQATAPTCGSSTDVAIASDTVSVGDAGDGVDVTLIRWMLSLSPEERLAVLQGFVDSVVELTPDSPAARVQRSA